MLCLQAFTTHLYSFMPFNLYKLYKFIILSLNISVIIKDMAINNDDAYPTSSMGSKLIIRMSPYKLNYFLYSVCSLFNTIIH